MRQRIQTTNNIFAHVVELRNVLNTYRARKELYPIYNVMPLKDIVDMLLRSLYDHDFFEILNHEMDERISNNNSSYDEYIDVFLRDIFLSEIIEDLEESITSSLGRDFDICDYKLNEWLGETTVVLVRC